MLLAVDIGNTNIVLGVFAGETLTESWRLATHQERTADELGVLVLQMFENRGVDTGQVDGIIVCSVVPPLTGTVIEMARRYVRRDALLIESGDQIGMPILYENPAEVGTDRLINGVAAFERHGRPRNAAVIVVDFGTATTFDAISRKGDYLGGVICPGIQISADALFQRAARLSRVDIRRPPEVVGRTTVSSMQSGLYFGQVAMVEGLVQRMRRELARDDGTSPPAPPAACIATGGMATLIAAEAKVLEEVDVDLTLHGLRIVWERNLPGASR